MIIYIYIYIIIMLIITMTIILNDNITVPQKGYAKRGSKKLLFLSDFKVTQK